MKFRTTIRQGDKIRIDAEKGTMDVVLSDAEIAKRLKELPPFKAGIAAANHDYVVIHFIRRCLRV